MTESGTKITTADHKALALSYALKALVRTLAMDGALDMGNLFNNLDGAQRQLARLGETNASALLGSVADSLRSIDGSPSRGAPGNPTN